MEWPGHKIKDLSPLCLLEAEYHNLLTNVKISVCESSFLTNNQDMNTCCV